MRIKEERQRLINEIAGLVIDFEQKTETVVLRIEVNHLFDDKTKQKTTKVHLVLSLT